MTCFNVVISAFNKFHLLILLLLVSLRSSWRSVMLKCIMQGSRVSTKKERKKEKKRSLVDINWNLFSILINIIVS